MHSLQYPQWKDKNWMGVSFDLILQNQEAPHLGVEVVEVVVEVVEEEEEVALEAEEGEEMSLFVIFVSFIVL